MRGPASVLRWLLLAYGLCLVVPWSPSVITDHYEYEMHVAAARGLQFGRDVIATYGPLGYLGLPYFHARTFSRLIAGNAIAYLVGVLIVEWLRYPRAVPRPWRSAWACLIVSLPAFMSTHVYAPSLYLPFALINLFVIDEFLAGVPRRVGRHIAFATILAVCTLVKPTFWVPIGAALATVSVDWVVTSRRFPIVLPVFAAALVAVWLAAGQRLQLIGSYFSASVDVVVGFREGMSYATRRSDAVALVFVAGSIVLVAAVAVSTARQLGWRTAGPAATLSASLFAVFQHGFARPDAAHILPACLALAMLTAVAIVAAGLGTLIGRAVAASAGLTLLACWWLGYGAPAFSILGAQPRQLWSLLVHGPARFDRASEDNLRALARAYPLAGAGEPIDTSAIDLALGDANGLRSTVRPAITAYSAFTPGLAAADQRYFDDATAGPATVLVDAAVGVDGRYPTVTDPLAWLSFRSRFEIARKTDRFLVLARRREPQSLRLVPLEQRSEPLGAVIDVPGHGDDPVWAQIDVRLSTAGTALSAAYKPPVVFITADTADGAATFQLTMATARAGMILSRCFAISTTSRRSCHRRGPAD